MKQIWSVFVLFVYIYGTDKLLLTKAEQIIIYSPKTPNTLTCPDPYVIKIEDATIHGENSTCSRDECVLSDSDFDNIKGSCNNNHSCIIDYPLNYSCLRENRYFNLSYTCLVPRNLACSFEFSWCNWRNIVQSNYVNWIRTSPATKTMRIPGEDHSTNSNAGYFLYTTKQRQKKTAVVGSGKMLFNEDKCLVIWYNMDSKSQLRIYKSTNDRNFTLLLETKNGSKTWQHINVTLEKGLPSEIFIHVTVDAYIAIDDTDIQDWPCNAIQPITCNFEHNFCNFEVQPKFGLKWERENEEDNSIGRPSLDHTKQVNGYYVYAQSLLQNVTTRRRLILPFDNKSEAGCLSLWYYIYGETPGDLYIYVVVNGSEKIVSFIRDARKELWRQFLVNVSKTEEIILEYNYTRRNKGGIALDDVYIAPIVCAGQESFSNECVEKEESLNLECQFADVLKDALTFDPKLPTSCPITYDHIFSNFRQILHQCNDTVCEFTPANLLKNNTCFMMLKHLSVRYKCIDPTIPENNSVETISTSSQLDATTSTVTKKTTIISSSPQTDVITDNLQSDSSSSTPVIGIVVGVVLSLVILSVILVIAFIYFKRYAEKKGHSIVANEDSHCDYIGHQNTAFSSEVNATTQTDYCEIRKSKLNDQYHDISDTFSPSINTTNDDEYSEIANVVNSTNCNPNPSTNYQHQYITLVSNATGFDRSNQHTNLHIESKNNHNTNEITSFTGGDDYAILDPDDLNESKNNTPKVVPLSENYVILDPTETGFNRKENTDTVCNYELATPINPTVTSEDPYDVSKDETYDTSSNSRHKDMEKNIYSHMVDNVYDTAGNQRKKEDNDGTYDHFFGQQSEDDYDISKPL